MSNGNGPQTAITKSQRDQQQNAMVKGAANFLRAKAGTLANYCRNKGLASDELVNIAIFEIGQNPKLAACTPISLYKSLVICAQFGLEPSGARQFAFLVPYKDECKVLFGYKGLTKLAINSGKVKRIRARVVFEGDDFVVHEGTEPKLHHIPKTNRVLAKGEKPPAVIAAYAIAVMADDSLEFCVMDRWELDRVREASKTADDPDGPWAKWPDRMQRKAAIRRLCGDLPLGADYDKAIAVDNAGESDGDVAGIIDLPEDAFNETIETQASANGGGRISAAIEGRAERKES